ncbi:MAG: zinc ribbon domain-containing protein [Gammaproteobacteria bacterium]|nr:zinc ribbon domain-containing protein [Gammaproteobacteria bacterium]
MPLYDFRCNQCKQECEVQQPINSEPPLCPDCGNKMKQYFSSTPAVHGVASIGRELAARSIPQCGKGCRCCP